MFEALDADTLFDLRDGTSFEADWLRAAETLQSVWDGYPGASTDAPTIDAVREAAFVRAFASVGHHDLAASISDDFELICRRTLLGIELPFVTGLEKAYDAQQIPHRTAQPNAAAIPVFEHRTTEL